MTRGASFLGDTGLGFALDNSNASSMALVKSSVECMLAFKTWSIWPPSRLFSLGALEDLSCSGGRPGIVAVLASDYSIDSKLSRDLRESMEISCTVVMGPSSGTLTFRRLTRLFWFKRIRIPANGEALGVASLI